MIKILNTSLDRLGVIKNAISSNRLEEINGENVLDFTAVLDTKLNSFIDENSVFELDNDYFDTAFFKKIANEDNTYTVEVESEHISYRLNNPDYDVEYFTESGTPTYILDKILDGTGFTVGIVEYTDVVTYSAQEAKSRRQLLMEFVAYLGGELQASKFVIGIVQHLGSTSAKPVIKDRNVKIVSKTVNKRTLDESGNPMVSYGCTPIYLPGDSYSLGDDIILRQKDLSINEELRVVSISRDVYDIKNVTFQFANYANGLESSLYRIATSTVSKDKLYNGCRIGPEFGFEAVRNDKKARAYFRSDGMKFQSGDGTGETWKDRLYFEYDAETDETVMVIDGKLSAGTIEALEAEFDVTISNTIIVNNLTAEKGNIAELTVDELDSSDKVKNYKADPKITDDVNYIRIYDQILEWLTAQKKESGTLSVYDRNGNQLYWLDETMTGVTNNVTAWPVTTFDYDEFTKLKIYFDESNSAIPIIEMGAGYGSSTYPERGKGVITKITDGLVLKFTKANGDVVAIKLGEEGAEGVDMSFHGAPPEINSMGMYANGMILVDEFATSVEYVFVRDGQGRITRITNETSNHQTNITWNSGNKP